MTRPVRIAVAGAGQIGRRHVAAIRQAKGVDLAAIADPSDVARTYAGEQDTGYHVSLGELIDKNRPDGIILATPNALHFEGALACIEAGIPVLVEKPLVSDFSDGLRLVEAADAAGVPLLTGHHRCHNPLISAAKAAITAGRIGRIVAVHATTWLMKPDDYFDVEWRRQPGAGPVYLNLIHDIDLLMHLCGDIVAVHAFETNTVRRNPVEDAAAIVLRFEDGALGTVSLADCVPAPWSWELTARENPAYPPTDESCYWIGGTDGSLELPNAAVWSCPHKKSWWEPIGRTPLLREFADPLVRQVENFAAVIRGEAEPLVTGRDGLKALAIIEAVKTSARTGRTEAPAA